MKVWFYIVLVLLVAVVGCNTSPPCGHPLSEGERLPRPAATPSQRGTTAHEALEGIDSLMWWQPDSALAVMMEFAGSEAADSLDEFDGHYCQVLIAELLYKNDHGQSNRSELLQAVGYFDSITQVPEPVVAEHGRSVEGPSKDPIVFLDARAHYINGVGYYERDSLIEACGEYLNALRMMEGHFEEKVLVGHKARFMALTYNRLVEMFSAQYMQEPAIYCGKQSFAYNRIAPTSPYSSSNILYRIGKQYGKLKAVDSTVYYYDRALELLPDKNNIVYRDIVASWALFDYEWHHDTFGALDSLKRIATQAANETERLIRYRAIGGVYYYSGQYDSAKVYLEPVLEKYAKREIIATSYLRDIAISEGDTVKANQYAQFLIEDVTSAANSQARVSQLNDLFQQHLQWEQEKALAEEQQVAKQRQTRIVVAIVVLLLTLGLGLWWWMAKRRKEHETETQTLNEEKQQLQTRVDDALQQLQTVDDALQQLQTQADDAQQQARAMLLQRVNDFYRSKLPNRLERILAEFEAAYPQALEKLAASYPELSETEQQIAVLNYLHFRAKEEADLLGLSDNTVNKYRSNLRKKTGNASFSSFLD